MYPKSTKYYLATSSADYKACHTLMVSEGIEATKLSWPTIIAMRDDTLVGFISTSPKYNFTVVDPLVVDGEIGHRCFVALRLAEVYTSFVRALGISAIHFAIEKSKKRWLAALNKLGLVEYAEDSTYKYFRREV